MKEISRNQSKPNYVYKYIYEDEVIYVGKTTSIGSRIRQHSYENNFKNLNCDIYYTKLNNGHASELLETLLINKYNPKFNIAKKETGISAEFEEPEWVKYEYSYDCFNKANTTGIRTIRLSESVWNDFKELSKKFRSHNDCLKYLLELRGE